MPARARSVRVPFTPRWREPRRSSPRGEERKPKEESVASFDDGEPGISGDDRVGDRAFRVRVVGRWLSVAGHRELLAGAQHELTAILVQLRWQPQRLPVQ